MVLLGGYTLHRIFIGYTLERIGYWVWGLTQGHVDRPRTVTELAIVALVSALIYLFGSYHYWWSGRRGMIFLHEHASLSSFSLPQSSPTGMRAWVAHRAKISLHGDGVKD